MSSFVGLDVSQRLTHLCVVDAEGKRVWRGKCATDPIILAQTLRAQAGSDPRVGIETGPLTPWLVHALRAAGIDMICVEARHAHAVMAAAQVNKNDRHDAHALAQLVRTGWYRAVHVKSYPAHHLRAVLGARAQLVGMVTRVSNHIRGVMKIFGLVVAGARGTGFAARVEELIADRPEVQSIVAPMLGTWLHLRSQVAVFDRQLLGLAKTRPECRLLMSIPGVGYVSALAFMGAIDRPERFTRSRAVGAHLGLTPKQHQSGEVDRLGEISKCGDAYVRTVLVEAANSLLIRCRKPSPLREWAVALERRSGPKKARTALARKLAVIMHSVWRTGQPYAPALPTRMAA
jgi:transposase